MTQAGEGPFVRTVCGCPAVSMGPVISPGSAPVWMAGQDASVIKVMLYSALRTC